MDLSKFESQIAKTGFVLEHNILKKLKSNGWTIISNKYYIDDAEESIREIDLIAYKVKPIGSIQLYTTLVISCKKSESNCWSFLSRNINKKDPNKNFMPLHVWSNNKPSSYQMERSDFPKKYYDAAIKAGIKSVLKPEFDVFAFQEMDKQSGAPKNDKAIFSSITSVMKAQSYELNALPKRKKEHCIFQFSLLNVIDADLIKIDFEHATPKASSIDEITYISNYIINKKEDSSRIHFVAAESFEKILQDYNNLHSFNHEFLTGQYADFFRDAIKISQKRKVLEDDFFETIKLKIQLEWFRNFKKFPEIKTCSLLWGKAENEIFISITTSDNDHSIDELSNMPKIKTIFAKALVDVYKYSGNFKINDTPFEGL